MQFTPQTSRQKGDAAVLLVAQTLVEEGFLVLEPRIDTNYDLVVEKNGKFCRIQVKSRESKAWLIKLELRGGPAKAGNYYSKKDLDFIALVEPHFKKIYWIPMEEIDGKKQIYLRERMFSYNRENPHIRLGRDYSIKRLKDWYTDEVH